MNRKNKSIIGILLLLISIAIIQTIIAEITDQNPINQPRGENVAPMSKHHPRINPSSVIDRVPSYRIRKTEQLWNQTNNKTNNKSQQYTLFIA